MKNLELNELMNINGGAGAPALSMFTILAVLEAGKRPGQMINEAINKSIKGF